MLLMILMDSNDIKQWLLKQYRLLLSSKNFKQDKFTWEVKLWNINIKWKYQWWILNEI